MAEMPRPWKEMTPQERVAYMHARKKEKRAEREAAAEMARLDAPAASLAEPVRINAATERRRRLLGDLDPTAAELISDEELEAIEREETAKALAEQKRQTLADIRAIVRQQARVAHDLIPANVLRSEAERRRLAEPVTFEVYLPEGGAGQAGQDGFRVDGRLYQQGRRYTVPRAEFESLQYTFYRAWLSEYEFATLNQEKRGHSAKEVMSRNPPRFEVMHA